MSKKIRQAKVYIDEVRKKEKLLSRLAEEDYDLYVLELLSYYANIPLKEVQSMNIKDLNLKNAHPTVQRVLSNYIKNRSAEEYLIKSRVSDKHPMSDIEYSIRKSMINGNYAN